MKLPFAHKVIILAALLSLSKPSSEAMCKKVRRDFRSRRRVLCVPAASNTPDNHASSDDTFQEFCEFDFGTKAGAD